MSLMLRPLATDDLPAVEALDEAYARRFGLEPAVTAGSVSFFSRSGHAFVAEGKAEMAAGAAAPAAADPAARDATEAASDRIIVGFVLAHAVWDGRRAVLWIERLVAAGADDAGVRASLIEAVTKSAYDAAIYQITAAHPAADSAGAESYRRAAYQPLPVTLFGRTLGARSGSS